MVDWPKPAHKLKPITFPDGFIMVIDTREQEPLFRRPPKGLVTVRQTLHNGDYSIKGFEDVFAVERKKISDLYSYLGKESKRTIEKLKRLREFEWAALVVEADEATVLQTSPDAAIFGKMHPEAIRARLVSIEVRYGLHVYYNKSKRSVERWVLDRATKFYRIKREG
jgi:ERCC4-type nuclease